MAVAELKEIIESPLVVQEDESLSKAIGLLRENQAYGVFVVSQGRFLGVIDDRSLLKFDGDAERTKCGKLVKRTPVLSDNSSPEEVVAGFINSEATVLPLVRNERLVGSITRRNALKLLTDSPAITGKRVADVMRSPPVTFPDEGTVAQAVAAMRGNRVYRLVVTDSRGRLAGVFSSYDLAVKVKSYGGQPFRGSSFRPTAEEDVTGEKVANVMSTEVVTIRPDAPLKEAVRIMIENNLRALVVVKENKPAGIVSAKNVFEACLVGKPLNVFVHGLAPDDRIIKQSIIDEGSAFLERLRKFVPLAPQDALDMHVKTSREGYKKRFEIKSRLTVQGKVFASRAPPDIDEHRDNWDAHLAVRESLDELEKIVVKTVKRRPKRERFQQHRIK
ncbi:MAG: CBS domain-containing protein [Candidatus Micrarchaeota archaeon]|nr:CBS domain-containing protein [Candidatus Micrarchaeota archaeon]